MKAYIEFPEEGQSDIWDWMVEPDLNKPAGWLPAAAVSGKDSHVVRRIPMEPKQYYIEFDHEEEYTVKNVSVDITGLDNEEIVRLLTALNEAGFEATITPAYKPPMWTPPYPNGARPVVTPPYVGDIWPYTTITYNNAEPRTGSTFFTKEEIPGQVGIHEYLEDED